jgi:murein DD-endopeptidase MepM/ murein hydrolase activator NlpD
MRHLEKGLFLCFFIAFLGGFFYQQAQWRGSANIINGANAADLENSQWISISEMREQETMNMESKTAAQETPLPETADEKTAAAEPAAQEINAVWDDTDIQRSPAKDDEERPWLPGHFIWPMEGALITSYGFEYAPTFADYRFHSGIDIAAVPGALVAAAAPGKVVEAGKSLWLGYQITIDHGQRWVSRYHHLESIKVRPEETVQAGQALGSIGQPGTYEEKEGAHVHFEILYEGVHIDPLLAITGR